MMARKNYLFYMCPGYYSNIIRIISNKKIPYSSVIKGDESQPEIQIDVHVDNRGWARPDMNGKRFGFVHKIADNSIYYYFPMFPGIILKLKIINLETNNPQMIFSSTTWRVLNALNWASRFYRHLYDVETAVLLNHGYYPLHCAAISKNDKAILLVAPENTGKTCASLLAIQHGYKIMAEERLIFDGNKLYPGMIPGAEVFSRLYFSRVQKKTIIKTLKNGIYKVLHIFNLGSSQLLRAKLCGSVKIDKCEEEPLKISNILFLEHGDDSISTITNEEAARRLHDNNKAEFTWRSSTILRGYSYFNSDFDIRKLEQTEDKLLNILSQHPNKHICSVKDPVDFIDRIEKVVSGKLNNVNT